MACELYPSKGITAEKKRRALWAVAGVTTRSPYGHRRMAGGGLVLRGSEKGRLRGLDRESEVATEAAPLVTAMCPPGAHM